MKKGEPVVVERVSNGYSIKKDATGAAVTDDELFVFETFQAIIEWLQTHFMEVGDE